MRKKVFAYMERLHMAEPGMRILAGFSGGADSTALLALLWEYGKRHGIGVCAVHVNHGIRGDEAWRDQTFCEAFCRERGIPFTAFFEDVPGTASREGMGLEEAGRVVRRRIFERELAGQGADRVALAHHQNDQAETMLFHLARGAGLRGLCGMEPVRLPYIRPFLCVAREEITGWLTKEGIPWVEDSTNQETGYTRNCIRHGLVREMEKIRPGAAVRMACTAEQLAEAEDYLALEAQKAYGRTVRNEKGVYRISLDAFGKLHPAMKKRVVLGCLEKLMGGAEDLEAVHVGQVAGLSSSGRGSRVMLPKGYVAVLGYGEILLKKGYGGEGAQEQVYCVPGGTYHYMGGIYRFTLENAEKNRKIPVNRYTKWFDYDKIKNGLVLRTRQAGDYLEPARGMHKKLKDYLIDCKVPREERSRCVLLADGSHIIWAVGMRISDGYKVTEQTKTILKVQKMENGGTEDGETSY